MKNLWTTWMLAGALLASLQWNLRAPASQVEPGSTDAVLTSSSDLRCELDPASLGLSSEQADELDRLCRTECRRADDFEGRAGARLRELKQLLGQAPQDEAELRDLVREISSLREKALMACVDSVLLVREVLDDRQLTQLLETCYRVDSCDSESPGCGVNSCSQE